METSNKLNTSGRYCGKGALELHGHASGRALRAGDVRLAALLDGRPTDMNTMQDDTATPTQTAASLELERIARTWHALTAREAVDALKSRSSGLTDNEVERRRQRFGANELPAQKPRSALSRFLGQLNNLLIYVLLGSATITAILGHALDTSVILGVIILNAIFGLVQEGKAERAIHAIRGMISPTASVIRNGERLSIPARELVPGDIMLIEAGDRVAADARLISARGLTIDESALTGESVPVEKRPQADLPDSVLAERASMAYSGTLVTKGQGTSVVVATGLATEIGRITTLLEKVEDASTPLIRQIDHFARQLSIGILALSAATLAFALLVRDYAVADAFLAVVGMAVAAIPEGLPAVMTITLAIGVERMSRRNAIVRRLPAVETLGSVSVICTDKTGTLTCNEMTARHVVTAGNTYEADGSGYAPIGALQNAVGTAHFEDGMDAALTALIAIATLCNDAVLREDSAKSAGHGGWSVSGDPMEGALVALAGKAGCAIDDLRGSLPRLDVIPFDAAHRFMATLHDAGEAPQPLLDALTGACGSDCAVAFVKGAPEDILALAVSEIASGKSVPIDHDKWQGEVARLAELGERTLAFALKPLPKSRREIDFDDIRGGLVLAGLVGLIDPPRDEARTAIAEARTAGIATKMITGDHALTALAIARDLGLPNTSTVVTGRDIDALSPAQLAEVARSTSVFARTAPEHKLQLVNALREGGAIIAMTGDGVNDAPALKTADVGIAMGRKGTEAAKEASQIVLLDDNFASIVAAVKEGRTVYDNLTKVIAWTLPTSFGQTFVVMLAILGGFMMPVTPVQILWINMVSAVALGLILAFEPPEPDVMQRFPRPSGQSLLTPLLAWQVAFVSLLFIAGAFGMFWRARSRGIDIAEARTIVVNTIVVMEIFYLFSVRYLHSGSLTLEGLKGTPAVLIGVGSIVVLQFAFTYLPAMQSLFETRGVALRDGVAIVAVGILLLIIVEIEKRVRHRWQPVPARHAS